MEFYQTFKHQFEVLPRATIIYGGNARNNTHNGLALEWLWFGVYVKIF